MRPLVVCLAASAFSAAAQAPEDVRVALVIGNAAYPPPAALANPGNDAVAMAATLRTLGFNVTELKDANAAQMREAVARLRDNLRGKRAVGMLYYAGHGLQVDFRNYMVPVDAKLAGAADVPVQTVDVGQVIDAFKAAGTRMNIVVLDACRDNPFAQPGGAKGLAPLDAPSGTLLAYATAPGNVAEDGAPGSGNGVYTSFLVKELQKPAARIEDVFKRVRLQVRQQSQGRQIPWESTSLEEDFYFNDGVKFTFRSADFQKLADSARLREEELRNAQQQAKEAEALARLSAEEARQKVFQAQKAEWERIRDSRNPEDFYAYLQKYPNGYVSEQAQIRLDQLQQVQVQAQRAPDAPAQPTPAARRAQVGDEAVFDYVDGFSKARQRRRQVVTRVDGDRVEINRGAVVLDMGGTMLKNQFGTHSPGILGNPADLAVGKRWKSAYETVRPDGVREDSFWEFRVTGMEEIEVPAGKFKAFRVEARGEARSSGGTTYMTGTNWVDPATMFMVRFERMFRINGRIVEYFAVELVRRNPMPRG